MKKLFISIATLAVAIIAMSTSTFAWFTMSGTANVEKFDVNVKGGTGILISSDGKEYKETLNLTDLSSLIAADGETTLNASGLALHPVTSLTGGEAGTSFVDLKGDAATGNTDYLEFSLWVQTSAASALPVYLEKTTSLAAKASSFSPLATFDHKDTTYTAGKSMDVYASNALRMSIQDMTVAQTSILSDQQVSSDIANDLGGVAVAATEGKFYATGAADSQFVAPDGVTASSETKEAAQAARDDFAKQFASVAYYNAVMNKSIGYTTTTDAGYYAAPTADYTYLARSASIITLNEGSEAANKNIHRVVVRIWAEGFDGDCFDAIQNSKVQVNLAFTTDQTAALVK